MNVQNSIWMEVDKNPDKRYLTLLQKHGIVNNHSIISDCLKKDKFQIIEAIKSSDQICFRSAFISGSDSILLIEELMYWFTNKDTLKDKRIICIDGFQQALNSGYKFPYRETYPQLFKDNIIAELADGKIKRIEWNEDLIQYVYTEIIKP